MRRIPVDPARLGEPRFVQSETRTDNEGKTVLRDGVPVQRVSVLVKPADERPEVLEVSVPRTEPFKFNDNEKVRFDNLRAMPWSTEGRSGVSYSADDVRPANNPGGPVKL